MVVSEEKEHYLVVDGFHRQLLGRKADTRKRLKGWLPVACINPEKGTGITYCRNHTA